MKNILLVEDLAVDVMLTKIALERHFSSSKVRVAHDGEEAYEMLKRDDFDLLLLDIKMPRVDGFELLERLRAAGGKQTPAIIVSGSGLQADRDRALELGAVDYVQKAVDYSAFIGDLKAALERNSFS